MKLLQEQTGVQLVSITVDPDWDTPEVLARYAETYSGLKPGEEDKWYFLTGDKLEIYKLIKDSFKMPVQETVGEDRLPGFEVIHSVNIMHVDAEGRVVGKYNALKDEEMATLRRVLQGKQKPKPVVSSITIGPPASAAGDEAERTAPEWVPYLPTVNASLNGLATVLLLAGYVLIKLRRPAAHIRTMLTAFSVSIVFLGCYLVYHAYAGSVKFTGTGPTRLVYFAILVSHIILAAVVPVLASITIYRGWAAQRGRGTWDRHKRIARITFPIWVYVSVTGVIIYVMLYHWPLFSTASNGG
jgi:protein SCO1/2/putative membrane protein